MLGRLLVLAVALACLTPPTVGLSLKGPRSQLVAKDQPAAASAPDPLAAYLGAPAATVISSTMNVGPAAAVTAPNPAAAAVPASATAAPAPVPLAAGAIAAPQTTVATTAPGPAAAATAPPAAPAKKDWTSNIYVPEKQTPIVEGQELVSPTPPPFFTSHSRVTGSFEDPIIDSSPMALPPPPQPLPPSPLDPHGELQATLAVVNRPPGNPLWNPRNPTDMSAFAGQSAADALHQAKLQDPNTPWDQALTAQQQADLERQRAEENAARGVPGYEGIVAQPAKVPGMGVGVAQVAAPGFAPPPPMPLPLAPGHIALQPVTFDSIPPFSPYRTSDSLPVAQPSNQVTSQAFSSATPEQLALMQQQQQQTLQVQQQQSGVEVVDNIFTDGTGVLLKEADPVPAPNAALEAAASAQSPAELAKAAADEAAANAAKGLYAPVIGALTPEALNAAPSIVDDESQVPRVDAKAPPQPKYTAVEVIEPDDKPKHKLQVVAASEMAEFAGSVSDDVQAVAVDPFDDYDEPVAQRRHRRKHKHKL